MEPEPKDNMEEQEDGFICVACFPYRIPFKIKVFFKKEDWARLPKEFKTLLQNSFGEVWCEIECELSRYHHSTVRK